MQTKDYQRGGMTLYRQQAADDRYGVLPDGTERFTVKSGDHWQSGGDSSDDRKHSERTEARSRTEDPVNDEEVAFVYQTRLTIPAGYPSFKPKQTAMQWFDEKHGYPVAFVRYEGSRLSFVTNYGSAKSDGFGTDATIPVTKGRPVIITAAFAWLAGEGRGAFIVLADGVPIAAAEDYDLVEVGADWIYGKYGIYRSGMDRYTGPKPAPDQTFFHADTRRETIPMAVFRADLAKALAALGTSSPAPAASAPSPAPTTTRESLGRTLLRWTYGEPERLKRDPSDSGWVLWMERGGDTYFHDEVFERVRESAIDGVVQAMLDATASAGGVQPTPAAEAATSEDEELPF